MKKLSACMLLVCLAVTLSCKKIQEKKEDLVISAITDGVWVVEQFFEAGDNISNDFLNYQFKFSKDGTVTGNKEAEINTGTWTGDITTYSIHSEFPNANPPISKLNGIWKLTDSYWDYVEAEMNTTNGKNILHLRKLP